MPFGDGTGPLGQGPRTGRGKGRGRGGTQNNYAGPGGRCICPGCGAQFPHQTGTPCTARKCPNCGTRLVRQ